MSFAVIGAVLGALAVLIGAFGAHGLREVLVADRLDIFETGVRYHMFHALALFAVAWLVEHRPERRAARVAGWLFVVGVIVFSGSLYLLAVTDRRWLGAITPVGGASFIAGWVSLALAARRASSG